jgi:hypothetical protein
MEEKIKNLILTILGTLYIILGIIAYYNGIKLSGISGILWFSYTTLFLIGLGILIRNSYLIASQLTIIFIPYIIWSIDFLYSLIFSTSFLGITDYVFQARPLIYQLITIQHLFIIPISLFSIYLIKLKSKDFWKISLAQITIFFLIVRILNNQQENVNCVFYNCLPFEISSAFYPFAWFFAYGLMIFLTSAFLNNTKIFKHNERFLRAK